MSSLALPSLAIPHARSLLEHVLQNRLKIASMIFNGQILQRDRPRTVMLIHGLFTTAGFWLPVLKLFPLHRIVLLNVDYARYFELADGVADFNDFLRRPELGLDDQVQIVGHSYGAVLAASTVQSAAQRYLLCPIFLATSVDIPGFATAVASRNRGAGVELASVQMRLEHAFSEARKVDTALVAARRDRCLIPDSDVFFQYGNLPLSAVRHVYCGDHFEVVNPVSQLVIA